MPIIKNDYWVYTSWYYTFVYTKSPYYMEIKILMIWEQQWIHGLECNGPKNWMGSPLQDKGEIYPNAQAATLAALRRAYMFFKNIAKPNFLEEVADLWIQCKQEWPKFFTKNFSLKLLPPQGAEVTEEKVAPAKTKPVQPTESLAAVWDEVTCIKNNWLIQIVVGQTYKIEGIESIQIWKTKYNQYRINWMLFNSLYFQ